MFESEVYLSMAFIFVIFSALGVLICTGASAIRKIKKTE
jgi:hypothetical protein